MTPRPRPRTRPRGPSTHIANTPNFFTASAASSGRTSPLGRSSGTRPSARDRVPEIARSTSGVRVGSISTQPVMHPPRYNPFRARIRAAQPPPAAPRPSTVARWPSRTPRRREKIGARQRTDRCSRNSKAPGPRSPITSWQRWAKTTSRSHRQLLSVQIQTSISLSPQPACAASGARPAGEAQL